MHLTLLSKICASNRLGDVVNLNTWLAGPFVALDRLHPSRTCHLGYVLILTMIHLSGILLHSITGNDHIIG
jgi:hypothetical protein